MTVPASLHLLTICRQHRVLLRLRALADLPDPKLAGAHAQDKPVA
jgi:hypothetical protein